MTSHGEAERGSVLIVDDEVANVRLLERLLEDDGFTDVHATTDPRRALALFRESRPDLVLLDLAMPFLDGFAVLDQIRREIDPAEFLPVLVLTADISREAKQRALRSGAKDFLTKPFDTTEAVLRIRNLLETRRLHRDLREHGERLTRLVRMRTHDLEESRIEILERLGVAAEYRDDATGEHTERIGRTCELIALSLGLPEEYAGLIRRAAPLHDLGKIGISDHVLLKPARLDPGEWDVMKTHTTIGARILSGSRSPLLQLAETIALTHHERWHATGYPAGLGGEDIPVAGRITALADVFDALTHERPYKKAWGMDEALVEIQLQSGFQFDPRVVQAFLDVVRVGDMNAEAGGTGPGLVAGVGLRPPSGSPLLDRVPPKSVPGGQGPP